MAFEPRAQQVEDRRGLRARLREQRRQLENLAVLALERQPQCAAAFARVGEIFGDARDEGAQREEQLIFTLRRAFAVKRAFDDERARPGNERRAVVAVRMRVPDRAFRPETPHERSVRQRRERADRPNAEQVQTFDEVRRDLESVQRERRDERGYWGATDQKTRLSLAAL